MEIVRGNLRRQERGRGEDNRTGVVFLLLALCATKHTVPQSIVFNRNELNNDEYKANGAN